MKKIASFEYGKQTEKDIKRFLGLEIKVAGAGQIDAVYNGISIEIKRGNCALYTGKAFSHYRKATNAAKALTSKAYNAKVNDTPLLRSEQVAYSIDGTVQQTYIISTTDFLHIAEPFIHFNKINKNKKSLYLVRTKEFLDTVQTVGIPLQEWKKRIDMLKA